MSRFEVDRKSWKKAKPQEDLNAQLPFLSDKDEPSTLDSNRQVENSAQSGQNQGQDSVSAENNSTLSALLLVGRQVLLHLLNPKAASFHTQMWRMS